MEEDFEHPSPPRERSRTRLYVALSCVGFGVLSLALLMGGFAWIALRSPETSVYPGDRVPERYVETLRELGALEEGETLLYFYSDGMLHIEEGFYLVSDSKVAVHFGDPESAPELIPYDEIAEASLERKTSFFEDSQITLELDDGSTVWFPVSSEFDRDVEFHQAIVERLGD